jgi:hypothetical protein
MLLARPRMEGGAETESSSVMTREEAWKHMDAAIDQLGEHFDAIQIHATWMPDGNSTLAVHRGSGNFYAREAMCREFIRNNDNIDQAKYIAEEINRDDK